MGRQLRYGKRYTLSIDQDLLDRADAWRAGRTAPSGKPISQSEALRQLIERGLDVEQGRGHTRKSGKS